MKTILIIDNNFEDATKTKTILSNDSEFNSNEYQIEILGNGKDNADLQKFYDHSNSLEILEKKIKRCEDEGRPVSSIVLDIFLTSEEEETLTKGYGYIASTSREILSKYGDPQKNGTFKETKDKVNILILSRFPQYFQYAESLSGDEIWGLKFYIGKLYFFKKPFKEYRDYIINVLKGEYTD